MTDLDLSLGCDLGLDLHYEKDKIELLLAVNQADGRLTWYGCEWAGQPPDQSILSETRTEDGVVALVSWCRKVGIEIGGHKLDGECGGCT